jgi:hypothetical protein
MRFKNGLALLTRTNVKGSWNLASFHSPHSLTWRWLLAFSLFRADEGRVWPVWMPHRSNRGLTWTLRIPFVGFLRFDQQRPMWYRDIWSRQRDREDRERYAKSSSRGHLEARPNIVDGGHALH